MITLQDAIERAKLASDDEGILSAYLYDQLHQSLNDVDRHAFTMALVDNGIQTKRGSSLDSGHIREVLGLSSESTEKAVEHRIDITEEFVRVAQQFSQSPGGIWMPEDDEEPAEAPVEEAPVEEAPKPDWGYQTEESVIEKEFAPSDDVGSIQKALEASGISVDKDGMVSYYRSSVPGLYNKKTPMKAIPLDSAIERAESDLNSTDNEQQRISDLQDVLSSLNSDFQDLEGNMEDIVSKFDDSMDNLEQFRYSENSSDDDIREIATGLSSVREYLGQIDPEVEDMTYGLEQHADTIKDLQERLDNYYQTQYTGYDGKTELAGALSKLKEMQETDPQGFLNAISNLGGVAASLFFGWK